MSSTPLHSRDSIYVPLQYSPSLTPESIHPYLYHPHHLKPTNLLPYSSPSLFFPFTSLPLRTLHNPVSHLCHAHPLYSTPSASVSAKHSLQVRAKIQLQFQNLHIRESLFHSKLSIRKTSQLPPRRLLRSSVSQSAIALLFNSYIVAHRRFAYNTFPKSIFIL